MLGPGGDAAVFSETQRVTAYPGRGLLDSGRGGGWFPSLVLGRLPAAKALFFGGGGGGAFLPAAELDIELEGCDS